MQRAQALRAALCCAAALGALVAAGPARADTTFDAAAAGAEHVRHPDDLVWALTAPCTAGDDTQQRQCRQLRDARAAELVGKPLLVDADPGALALGAWDPKKRSVAVRLTACIRCDGLAVAGTTWYLTGGDQPPRVAGGALEPANLYDTARTFPDEAAARKWLASVAGARIELLVRLPAKPRWSADGRTGLRFDVLGYRVVVPCTGAVVLASPAAAPVAPDKHACPKPAAAK